MKRIVLFSLMFVFALSSSCKDKDPEPNDFSCDNEAKITSQTLGDIAMTIEYDDQGRINKVYRADGQGLIENYVYQSAKNLNITRNFKDGGVGNKFSVVLNDDGYIVKYATVDAAAGTGYTIENKYDSDGFIEESNGKFQGSYPSTQTKYVVENGNVTSVEAYTGGKLEYTQKNTYSDDLNKADLLFNQNQPNMYGRVSKNLVKTMLRTYADGKTEQYEYTYNLSKNDFVQSLTQTYTDKTGTKTTQVNKYDYKCF